MSVKDRMPPGIAGLMTEGSGMVEEPGRADGPPERDLAAAATARAREGLAALQRPDGHYVFELEADVTIPAEYVLLRHFLGDPDPELEARIGRYLRRWQSSRHDGWPLFHDGDFDISASVKAYYALKLIGDDPQAAHMARARAAILERGGAATANVFTRFTLALMGQVPWRAVPETPVHVMLLPRWAPFHIEKVAYWSRTVMVPLAILATLRPEAVNPTGRDVRELFTTPPESEPGYITNPMGSWLGRVFIALDQVLKSPVGAPLRRDNALRRAAMDRAVGFIAERLNGEDGLGAIYPAMANAVMAFRALGYADGHPDMATALGAVERLVTHRPESPEGDRPAESYVQPCLSPVWDTGLAVHGLMEAGMGAEEAPVRAALDWLAARQVTELEGDFVRSAPGARPGGWAFQYRNDHYPDVDDTAVVAAALHRADPQRYREPIRRAEDWIRDMQSRDGGWGAFDANNDRHYLNHIPFADHGALLDPPTSDVTARCVGFLGQLGHGRADPVQARGLAFLARHQNPDGSWFGRWGTNYVYGTWSVLTALAAAGVDSHEPWVRRAARWLIDRQRDDGGWGEDGATYWAHRTTECKESTPSQTAWALLGLMAAGRVDHPAVARGVRYLHRAPRTETGGWAEPWYTAVGFPRVFYLRYHGYPHIFPLLALARYAALTGNAAGGPDWAV